MLVTLQFQEILVLTSDDLFGAILLMPSVSCIQYEEFVFFGVLHAVIMLIQEPSRPRHDLDGVQPLYQGSQTVSNEYAEPGTMALPQQDRGRVKAAAGRNAASREMLRVSFS